MDQSPGLGSSLRLFAEQKEMYSDASSAGCRGWKGSLTREALLHRAKPRDFLEVKEPKEVVLERGWGRTFLSQKGGGGGGEAREPRFQLVVMGAGGGEAGGGKSSVRQQERKSRGGGGE